MPCPDLWLLAFFALVLMAGKKFAKHPHRPLARRPEGVAKALSKLVCSEVLWRFSSLQHTSFVLSGRSSPKPNGPEPFGERRPQPSGLHLSVTVDNHLARLCQGQSNLQRTRHELLIQLLEELSCSWTLVAKVVGLSIPAIPAWHHGGQITNAHQQQLARLVAAFELLARVGTVSPASRLDRRVWTSWASTRSWDTGRQSPNFSMNAVVGYSAR